MWFMKGLLPRGSEQLYDMIQEESLSPFSSKSKTRQLKAPCRTPMGEYIIPEGGKPLTSLGDALPGPSDYVPKVEPTKTTAPQYSIVGKPKIIDDKRSIPGPFEYNCSDSINWKTKTITLKGRSKSYFDVEAEKSNALPGKYKVEYKSVGKQGPKFKVGTKGSHHNGLVNTLVHPVDTKGFQTPGPNYRPNSTYWGRGHKKSFGIKCPDGSDKSMPGPGDYDVKTDSRVPSYSFGIKLPEPVSVQQSVNKFSPAANTYDIGTTIGKAPAISITGRQDQDREAKKGPCPSAYNPGVTKFDYYKATTLTYRWFESDGPTHPGPADYSVNHVNLKNNPSFSCRQRVKPSFPDSVICEKVKPKNIPGIPFSRQHDIPAVRGSITYERALDDTPGPGAYNLMKDFVINDKPAFSFRKKLDPVVSNQFPGPNSYEVEKRDKPGCKKAPVFSMAKRLVPPNSMKDTPGPCEYTPKLRTSEKAIWTMNKRPKGKGTFVNPGPNVYTLPEAISGKNKGVGFKSRASPYVYSGHRSTKLEEPRSTNLPVLPAIQS